MRGKKQIYTGLTIGIPTSGRPVMPQWSFGMMMQQYPQNTTIGVIMWVGKEVGDARNTLVEKAIECNSKYIWFVDDDTAPPANAVSKLIYELDQNQDIPVIGGIYCSKSNPPAPIVYRGNGRGAFWNWKVGEVFECTGVGTGCMLVRVDVFKKLRKPWFKTTIRVVDKPKNNDVVGEGFSDDLYFCDKVVKKGYKILAHGGVLCDHWDMKTGLVYKLPEDSLPYKERKN